MPGLLEMLDLGGAGATAVLLAGPLALALLLALFLGSLFRFRIPAPFWLVPGGLLVVLGTAHAMGTATTATAAMPDASWEAFGAMAAHGFARTRYADVLALFLATPIFLLTGIATAASGIRATKRRWTRSHAAIPAACGTLGAVATGLAAVLNGRAPLIGAALGAIVLVAGLSTAAAASLQARDPAEGRRLAGLRGVTALCGLLAVHTWILAWRGASQLEALARVDDLDAAARALDAAAVLPWLGLVGTLALGLGTVGALSPVARKLVDLRALVGAGLSALLVAGLVGGRFAMSFATSTLRQDAFGGAAQHERLLSTSALPLARTLAGSAFTQQLAGSCWVVEGREGWIAGPLFAGFDSQAHVDRAHPTEGDFHELDALAGCPKSAALLDGPLSTFEIPAVVVSADRLAPALGGRDWFVREGDLQLVVATRSVTGIPPALRAHYLRRIPIHWELPPETTPAGIPEGGEPGDWNFEAARSLLEGVHLLEGPVPMLISGGSRAWLEDGETGVQQIRDALLIAEKRDLILVPRRNWTVDDVAHFCLSAISGVDDARCVIRPENTARWSERTGLALPW